MTNEEKLIKFLNTKYYDAETNKVSINKHELPTIGLEEKEVIRTIHLLQQDHILEIERMSVHNDLSITCEVVLTSDCVHYFENKKASKVTNRRSWIQTYIPNVLSAVAIVISIIALIISLS